VMLLLNPNLYTKYGTLQIQRATFGTKSFYSCQEMRSHEQVHTDNSE
jgi:hypothetical protein